MECNIALLQLAGHGLDQDFNLGSGFAACREAKQKGADLALFPEMWNIAYTLVDEKYLRTQAEFDRQTELWKANAIAADSPFVQAHGQLARELQMAIGVTYLEKAANGIRNTLSLFDRHGAEVLRYAKVHTCAFSSEKALTPGDGFPVVRLDTPRGPVQVGAMICFDREFPESARILALGGAEILLVPNACEMEQHRSEQLRSRAFENMVGIALANYALPPNHGHSMAIDPMVFDANGRSRTTTIFEAGHNPGVFMARFDMDAIRKFRRNEVWGSHFRHPEYYQALVAPRSPSALRGEPTS